MAAHCPDALPIPVYVLRVKVHFLIVRMHRETEAIED